MELTLTAQESEPFPEPGKAFEFTTPQGLLNSNYKTVVKRTYNSATTSSVFGMRRHLKFSRFNKVYPIDVILKLSVFAFALVLLF